MNTQDVIALREESDEIELSMASIRHQIELSGVYPEDYTEKGWKCRARHALRMKGIRHQQLLREMSNRKGNPNRRQKGIDVANLFVDAARDYLEEDEFNEIMSTAITQHEVCRSEAEKLAGDEK
jgi:hypothetical protein